MHAIFLPTLYFRKNFFFSVLVYERALYIIEYKNCHRVIGNFEYNDPSTRVTGVCLDFVNSVPYFNFDFIRFRHEAVKKVIKRTLLLKQKVEVASRRSDLITIFG